MKLQEFFTQQFDTSKRALSTWGPGPYLPPKTPVISTEKGAAELCKQQNSCPASVPEKGSTLICNPTAKPKQQVECFQEPLSL